MMVVSSPLLITFSRFLAIYVACCWHEFHTDRGVFRIIGKVFVSGKVECLSFRRVKTKKKRKVIVWSYFGYWL